MNIANAKLLWLLILLLPLIWAVITLPGRYRKRFSRFSDSQLWEFYFRDWSFFFYRLKAVILLVVFGFITISLARPQWDREDRDVSRTGLDIAICIDVSKSMDATDLQPSRLSRAQDQIAAFIDEQKGDRIALIPFAGVAAVQCPLTDDYDAVKLLLKSLNTNSIPVWGTDIGAALNTATALFDKNTKNRIVILISDGEDLSGAALKAAKAAAAQGITIYTMGVGTPMGTKIDLSPEDKSALNVEEGIVSKLNNETLQKIAAVTKGEFFMVTPTQDEIAAILKHISGVEKSRFSSKRNNLFKEQYRLFIIAALLLLIVESLISTKVKRSDPPIPVSSQKPKSSPAKTAGLPLLLLIFIATGTFSSLNAITFPWTKAYQNSRGNAQYKSKDYPRAEQTYRKNSLNNPKDPVLQYNHANSLYRQKQQEEAAKAYAATLNTQDNMLKSKAWQNLGNLQYGDKKYEEAMQSYRQAILANQDNKAARTNYDLAKRMKVQQQQQQQQKNQQQKGKNKPQDPKKPQADKNKQDQQPPPPDQQKQDEKQKAADRLLKALEQKEVNDRNNRQGTPQRMQNNKWW